MIRVMIQARMGASRLPGKVLLPLMGEKKALEVLLERLNLLNNVGPDNIYICTTTNPKDNVLVDQIAEFGDYNVYRGDEDDVINRVYECCKEYKFAKNDTIIEITGDCPIICPYLIQNLLDRYDEGDFDYLSNVITRSFPDGMDIQIYSFNIFEKAVFSTTEMKFREHVGWNILNFSSFYQDKCTFKIGNVPAMFRYFHPEYRLTLDTPEDYKVLKAICEYFNKINFTLGDVLSYIERKPELLSNSNIATKLAGVSYEA